MLFHSLEFLLGFLPIVFCGYLVLAHCQYYRVALVWLTVASLIFYGWWNPTYLWLIGGSILGNFTIGRLMNAPPGSPHLRHKRIYFILGIAANLLALGYYKYANFFVDNINAVFQVQWNFAKVILPLAVSFFTFTQIAYLVDTYRGETKRYGLVEYSFFVTFFPHLIAGPIVLHKEIMPQVEQEGAFKFAWINLKVGAAIFLVGLFKKIVLADGCGEYVRPFFAAAAGGQWLSMADTWGGVLAYTFQLYFDFSGYSDMAIGVSRIFGILLPLNFASPYRATSIVDFWRRWHISLSRFLRNYLYIPLGGSRRGVAVRYSNLMLTMLLGGLWHGAGWTFLIWGGLHGAYLVVNHAFRAVTERYNLRKMIPRPIGLVLGWALTMLAVVVGWVFFRSPDVETALHILRMMIGLGEEPEGSVLGMYARQTIVRNGWLLGMAAIALLMPNTQSYFAGYRPAYDADTAVLPGGWSFRWKPSFLHGCVMGVLVFFTVRRFFQLAPSEFLYFNF